MQNKYIINMDGYNRELAMICRRGISFDSEKYGESQGKSETIYLNECKDDLFKLIKVESEIEFYNKTMDYFINGYINKLNQMNQAMSGCVSSMITGPANFKPNNRANSSYEKRVEEIINLYNETEAYTKKYLKKIRTREAGGELAQKKQELEALEKRQENMKAINKITLSKRISNTCKIEKCRKLDLSINLIEELKIFLSDKEELTSIKVFESFSLTNNNAKIKARKSFILRQEKIEVRIQENGATTTVEYKGGEIIQDLESQRINIIFDGKPEQAIIDKIKSHGFKWSPKFIQWTRKLTPNALYSTKIMIQEG